MIKMTIFPEEIVIQVVVGNGEEKLWWESEEIWSGIRRRGWGTHDKWCLERGGWMSGLGLVHVWCDRCAGRR